MRIAVSLVSAALVALPLVATAQVNEMQRTPVAPTTAAASAKNSKDPNRMVCRTMESTGSRLGAKRECRTASEWAAISAEQRRDIERTQANRVRSN